MLAVIDFKIAQQYWLAIEYDYCIIDLEAAKLWEYVLIIALVKVKSLIVHLK